MCQGGRARDRGEGYTAMIERVSLIDKGKLENGEHETTGKIGNKRGGGYTKGGEDNTIYSKAGTNCRRSPDESRPVLLRAWCQARRAQRRVHLQLFEAARTSGVGRRCVRIRGCWRGGSRSEREVSRHGEAGEGRDRRVKCRGRWLEAVTYSIPRPQSAC